MENILQDNLTGILIKAFGGFYFVQVGESIYSCSLRGKLKQQLKGEPLGLLVGDRVMLTATGEHKGEETGVIDELLPRRNFLIRPKIANIEQCLIVLAAEHPKPDFLLLDRLLVCLLAADIRPVLCFNKLDRPGAGEVFRYMQEVYGRQAGFAVFGVSALTAEGIEPVAEQLRGRLSAVAGPSGVGKSTLLNRLQTAKPLVTGEISKKLQRGRHTTRAVELLTLAEGGWIADTPGFSRLNFPESISGDNLALYYPEMKRLAPGCRFDMCRHDQEPDCAVKEAVAEGMVSEERWRRYLTFLTALQNK